MLQRSTSTVSTSSHILLRIRNQEVECRYCDRNNRILCSSTPQKAHARKYYELIKTQNRLKGFTIIELLIAILMILILAGLIFPVFARAKESALKSQCLSQLRQEGVAMELYLGDSDGRYPDRRDLKQSLEGGYHPWIGWPVSDPRAGWFAQVSAVYRTKGVSRCPVANAKFKGVLQIEQNGTNYWMWRFDRADDPIPLADIWGKTPEQAVLDLQTANDPNAGNPNGLSDLELVVDPYFPKASNIIPASLKGRAVHSGGRNRLFGDIHVRFLRDPRTDP